MNEGAPESNQKPSVGDELVAHLLSDQAGPPTDDETITRPALQPRFPEDARSNTEIVMKKPGDNDE